MNMARPHLGDTLQQLSYFSLLVVFTRSRHFEPVSHPHTTAIYTGQNQDVELWPSPAKVYCIGRQCHVTLWLKCWHACQRFTDIGTRSIHFLGPRASYVLCCRYRCRIVDTTLVDTTLGRDSTLRSTELGGHAPGWLDGVTLKTVRRFTLSCIW
ncbi:hypothetical protein BDZ89DRAFT_775146 [Hymenopellis radicata]|nr:hypothetical protein BDZ89DRAFT_775146 [Hymenopellis radicata]